MKYLILYATILFSNYSFMILSKVSLQLFYCQHVV